MRISTVLLLFLLSLAAWAQEDGPAWLAQQIRGDIARIDALDGTVDQRVQLKSELQSQQATTCYITRAERITERILRSADPRLTQMNQLRSVREILQEVDEKNVHFYSGPSSIFSITEKIQRSTDEHTVLRILMSNVHSSLQLIPFFVNRPIAKDFLTKAAETEPAELLRHYKEFRRVNGIGPEVIVAVATHAPMKLKTYLFSGNEVQKDTRSSLHPVVSTLYQMVRQQKANSKAAVLLNDVVKAKISMGKAQEISGDPEAFLDYLIAMRTKEIAIGQHSVDEALYYESLKRIRKVNELHDESDAVRFASMAKYGHLELYTLMVYSEDEIFTSTFLGLFKRMKQRMGDESSYQFLHQVNYLKFRTFIKMCAGYNVLSDFLAMMSDFEKQLLFKRLVEGLEGMNDNLKSAVAVADTYGSMVKVENRMLLEESILRYFKKIRYTNDDAERLYSTLIQVLGLGEGQELGLTPLPIDLAGMHTLKSDRLFKDGTHVQQHFFFDDPDGRSSYETFLGTFRSGNWQIMDKGTYVIIKSTKGKQVEVYLNKPQHEYAGQRAIQDHFKEQKRWPDVVVHRGHSYFANTSIASLTPNAELVFLGSCGGYNNITEVLNYSPDAQIISSKQIGTMWVNNRLCYRLNETIRKGQDVDWERLWKQVAIELGAGSTSGERFQDYIPPHKNMGALLIKAYRAGL